MALLRLEVRSDVLGMTTPVQIIIPDGGSFSPIAPPVLYLLHGLSDNETSWIRFSNIERYARDYRVAVVMPAAYRTFYADSVSGFRYFTYLAEELPGVIGRLLRVSGERAHTFAAGVSIGGYGALKLGLRYPERFAAVAGISSALLQARMLTDRVAARGEDDPVRHELHTVFGPALTPENDIAALADMCAGRPDKPKIFLCCGGKDHFFGYHRAMRARLDGLGFDLTYAEHEQAGHDWDYWDACVRDVLAWLPLEAATSRAE